MPLPGSEIESWIDMAASSVEDFTLLGMPWGRSAGAALCHTLPDQTRVLHMFMPAQCR